MSDLPHPAVEEIELTAVLAALADPTRLGVVRALVGVAEPGLACECLGDGAPKSTRSHHLRTLREAGVVRSTPAGRQRLVTLRRDDLEQRFPGLLDAVLGQVPAGT